METTPSAEAPTVTKTKSRASLRGVYLRRLKRLLRLRREHNGDLNTQGIRLLDRSIFAAYCDCLDVGVGEKAREVLRETQFTAERLAAGGGSA